jgi:xanthine dehydrogenase YagR molybdenum-binding subunit
MDINQAAIAGQPVERVDGHLKVTGQAKYAAEFKPNGLVQGVLIQATIGRGKVMAMDVSEAERVPGVLGILTRQNAPRFQPYPERLRTQGWPGERRVPLQDDDVHWQGQHLGVVVAETLEQARYAASLVHVDYQADAPVVDLDDERAQATAEQPEKFVGREKLQVKRGDPAGVLANAELRLEATYETPIENHNPIETFATIAVWEDRDRLLLYEATRWIKGIQEVVATAFALPAENVRVVAPFVGGAFGSKGFTWSHILLTAAAAQLVDRPVKLNFSRHQMFDSAGQRARTRQTFRMAAGRDGRLTAIQHDSVTHCSPVAQYTESCGTMTRRLYACPNVEVTHTLLHLNLTTPCPMRAPGEAPGVFALECAMDEMAERVGLDPLEFRLRNYAETDPEEGRPWSSKQLRLCYQQGAERFGWATRPRAPRSMQTPDGKFIGWGMATSVYPANQMPASVKLALDADGLLLAQSATHEIGTGTYTGMSQLLAASLGLPLASVRFELGDSTFPEAPINGGSWLTASVGAAALKASAELQRKLVALATQGPNAPFAGEAVECRDGCVTVPGEPPKAIHYRELLRQTKQERVTAEAGAKPGPEREKFSFLSFGAVFVEVHVDPRLGHVQVSRVVGVYDAGRVINPRLAHSQLLGGVTFGLGMALLEQTLPDVRTGRNVNPNLAEYLIPVCADTPPGIDLSLLGMPDPHMPEPGVHGIGEIGIVGTAAAIANAVYHATGRRVRQLPITLDKLL